MSEIEGLGDRRSSNTIFLSVVRGEFAQRFTEHQFDQNRNQITEVREQLDDKGNKTGVQYIERYFGSVTGMIEKAFVETVEFAPGKKAKLLKFVITKGDHKFQVSMGAGSGYAKSLYKRLPAVHPDKEVKFTPYRVEDKSSGNINAGITVEQEGRKFESLWTKDNPGQCPPAVQVQDEFGEMKWDFKEQNKFLYSQFKNWAAKLGTINPNFQGSNVFAPQNAQASPDNHAPGSRQSPTPPSNAQSPNPAQAAPNTQQIQDADEVFEDEDDDLPF